MTKVKLLTPLTGAKGSFAPGDIYPCTKDEAKRLIEKGFAKATRTSKKTAKK